MKRRKEGGRKGAGQPIFLDIAGKAAHMSDADAAAVAAARKWSRSSGTAEIKVYEQYFHGSDAADDPIPMTRS